MEAALKGRLAENLNPKTETHLAQAIGHEVKVPIRRNEGDGAVILKACEAHTLVELDILQLHCLHGIVKNRPEKLTIGRRLGVSSSILQLYRLHGVGGNRREKPK